MASEERGKRERVQAAVNQPEESCKSHSGHLGDVAEDRELGPPTHGKGFLGNVMEFVSP